jgi:hypothetical protein
MPTAALARVIGCRGLPLPVNQPGDQEPPLDVSYTLEEALSLLANLEDARDALIHSGQLATVVGVENEIRLLSRKLRFQA